MISAYLDSLSAELRVPARVRRRILAEARDHLEEAIAAGRGEREAVEAFGDPRELAVRFHEELASATARRASVRTAVLMVSFIVAMALAALGRRYDFPFGIVVWFGAQLAVVAGALGFARWFRYRSELQVPADRLADVYRANGLAVACVAVVALAEGVDALIGGEPAVAIVSGVVLVGALAAARSVAQAIARARVVPAAAPREDALDDLRALSRLALAGAPRIGSLADGLARELHDRIRRGPWRFCLVFAVACGAALAVQHGVADGGLSLHYASVWRALFASFLIASIEALGVVACFAAFGRFLGIRR